MYAMDDKTASKTKPKFSLHLALLTGHMKNINSVIQEFGLDISPVNSRSGTPVREHAPDLEKNTDSSPRFLPVISGSPTHETTPRKNDSPVLNIIRRTSGDKVIGLVDEKENSLDDETVN
jgi:hypothetical protein